MLDAWMKAIMNVLFPFRTTFSTTPVEKVSSRMNGNDMGAFANLCNECGREWVAETSDPCPSCESVDVMTGGDPDWLRD